MSQGTQDIANLAGAAFRAALNLELKALVSLSSGLLAPTTTYGNKFWIDTTTSLAKKRNNADGAWQTFASMDFDRWLLGDGTVALSAYSFSADPDTGMYRIGANNIGFAVGGANIIGIGIGGIAVNGTITALGAQPSLILTDATWAVASYLQAGANVTATGVGNYCVLNVPTGKGFSFAANNVSYFSVSSTAFALNVPLIANDGADHGQVLIGGPTAWYAAGSRLQVNNAGTGAALELKQSGSDATQIVEVIWNNATSANNSMMAFYTEATAAQRGSIYYNRPGGVIAYATTSDYRVKDLFGAFTGSGALIDSVPVHLGMMKGASERRPMFVAHELQAVAPWAVNGVKDAVDDEGNAILQQVDHQVLVPALWAEVKLLRARLLAAGIA